MTDGRTRPRGPIAAPARVEHPIAGTQAGELAEQVRELLTGGAEVGVADELKPPRRREPVATAPERVGQVRAIGCGIGRMARVLVAELRPPGSYDGFDIVAGGIAWCRRHYRDTPVPFRFQHADLHNAEYNPRGTQAAVDYRFPYADGSFDLALATSVFTHLLPEAADRYLAETARVLAPGGRLFATWLLLGVEGCNPRASRFGFPDTAAPAAFANPDVPEAAVGFQESWLRERLRAHRLELREPIHYGTWAGGAGASFQDIVLAARGPERASLG